MTFNYGDALWPQETVHRQVEAIRRDVVSAVYPHKYNGHFNNWFRFTVWHSVVTQLTDNRPRMLLTHERCTELRLRYQRGGDDRFNRYVAQVVCAQLQLRCSSICHYLDGCTRANGLFQFSIPSISQTSEPPNRRN